MNLKYSKMTSVCVGRGGVLLNRYVTSYVNHCVITIGLGEKVPQVTFTHSSFSSTDL